MVEMEDEDVEDSRTDDNAFVSLPFGTSSGLLRVTGGRVCNGLAWRKRETGLCVIISPGE
jgi:hypothetical protein